MNKKCPLCNNSGKLFYEDKRHKFIICSECTGIFLSDEFLPTHEDEEARYKTHNNDIFDSNYRNFTSPIFKSVTKDFTKQHSGLDFGSGTGPVISQMLKEINYQIETYDPFFCNKPEVLEQSYDYIVCCEVIEHFHNPFKEFSKLRRMLNPLGKIYCMTDLYHEDIDFKLWYYKNDPTHVFFYNIQSLNWIKNNFAFSELQINQRLVIFSI